MSRAVASASLSRRYLQASVLRWIAVGVVLVVFLFPLVWMVLAAFKSNLDITDPTATFSFRPTLSNFVRVLDQQAFLQFVANSAIVGAASTSLSLLVGTPAAYVMSRHRMQTSAGTVLLARIIPGVCLLVPWYLVFSRIGWVGSFAPLIVSHMFVTLPLVVWIVMSFFDSLPLELEESGRVDGLTDIGVFLRISTPLARPGLATATILALVFSWNNFMFALVLAGEDTKTLPVAIFNFIAYSSIDWGALMAGSTVMTLPVVLIALVAQRHIVSGLTAGATKG